jgi:hypothetical protein
VSSSSHIIDLYREAINSTKYVTARDQNHPGVKNLQGRYKVCMTQHTIKTAPHVGKHQRTQLANCRLLVSRSRSCSAHMIFKIMTAG